MKKENVFKIAIIVVAVAITGGVVGFKFTQRAQAPIEQATNVQSVAQTKNVTAGSEIQSSARVAKAGYKIVEVKNPEVPFSFEVPEKWLTETRNSEEKQPSVEEMRDFLGTQYTYADPDSGKTLESNAYYLGNGKENSGDVKTLTKEEIQQAFKDSNFPNASVSSVDYIWYGEFNASQIDFRVEDGLAGDIVNNVKTGEKEQCKNEPIDSNAYGCGNFAPKWEKIMIAGKNVYVETFATDRDEKGNELTGKGSSGGKTYYIETPNVNKTLVLKKQARGDAQFEKDFDNLIQTLKIGEKNSANISQWQAYADAKNGFEFSYPGEFGIVADENGPIPVMLDKVFLSGQSSYVFQVNTWAADDKDAPDFFKIKNNTDVSDWVINKQGKKYAKENGKYFSNKIGSKFNVDGLETLHLVSRQKQGGFYDDFYFIKNGNLYMLEIVSELNMMEDLKLEDSSQWYVKLLSSFSFTK